MNTERLTILRDALIADAKNVKGVKFDLSSWLKTTGKDAPSLSCGTYACAVGLACLLPELQEQGLGIEVDTCASACHSNVTLFTPTFNGEHGFEAAEAFFDIEPRVAEILFDETTYDVACTTGAGGETNVAERITDLLSMSIIGFMDRYGYSDYYDD